MIKVLVIEPNKSPYVMEIQRELSAYQKIVGGFIEVITLFDGTILVCNEEGKLRNLSPNKILRKSHLYENCNEDTLCDILYGTFFLVSFDGTDEFCSLEDEKIQYWTKAFVM